MPKTADTLVRDQLGDNALLIIRLKAALDASLHENIALKADVERLQSEVVRAKIWKPEAATSSTAGLFKYAPES